MAVVDSNLLKSKMVARGYNIGTLASAIGVDRDTISNILNGKSKPSYPVMNGIFFTLKLDPEEATNIFFAKELS
ncbi:helix-turn-helix transcriptional regulator [Ignavigranum ruoffiae]|uniref:helix-turn-helix transcriptional regulator n=1 Tax=Ignavigranum ruoffiae TaxID=89093 RepID=UPI0023550242|nr:helix-turn-helix transcriptional regulator [Ignavigranum ruoffiae]